MREREKKSKSSVARLLKLTTYDMYIELLNRFQTLIIVHAPVLPHINLIVSHWSRSCIGIHSFSHTLSFHSLFYAPWSLIVLFLLSNSFYYTMPTDFETVLKRKTLKGISTRTLKIKCTRCEWIRLSRRGRREWDGDGGRKREAAR